MGFKGDTCPKCLVIQILIYEDKVDGVIMTVHKSNTDRLKKAQSQKYRDKNIRTLNAMLSGQLTHRDATQRIRRDVESVLRRRPKG